jgi:predicted amidohydrolase YtcJ
MSKTTIYAAKKIITMNPRQPIASHVAVKDGHILGTGDLVDLEGWGPYDLEQRFSDKVLMPGFVEGHSHLAEGALWQDVYVGYHDRMDTKGVVHKGLDSIDSII